MLKENEDVKANRYFNNTMVNSVTTNNRTSQRLNSLGRFLTELTDLKVSAARIRAIINTSTPFKSSSKY